MSTETPPRADPDAESAISLSVVLPGLNEEANVERAVRRTLKALESNRVDFEILVIDDGSRDRTGEIAERLAADDDRIRVIRNPHNVNYGVSLHRGIREARREWVLHNGMDLPLDPEDLPTLLRHCEEADVIVASRTSRSAHSPWRRLTSWTNNQLLRLLFAPRTRDLNFTQLYRRSFLSTLTPLSTSPAFVTPELILRAEQLGLRVREVSVEFRRREAGKAHFGKPKDILWTLRDMIRLRLHTWLRGWQQ